jgi:hypothetical protein
MNSTPVTPAVACSVQLSQSSTEVSKICAYRDRETAGGRTVSSVQGEWRPDPTGRHEYRYWDGVRDTEHVADGGVVSIDSELPSQPLSIPGERVEEGSPATDNRRSSIEVGFGQVARQNRWTVAFRSLLLIPQAVVLFVLELAASVVVIIGWFAALVLGRLPRGIASFLTRVLQYYTRLVAYAYLLFDAYPPFKLSEANYPATVELRPTKLNRLAVLFRLVLMIPTVIVNQLATLGVAVASFIIWLIVLIAGRMPRALSEAVAAIVRYQTRLYGYIVMVTSTYPGGLFGDKLPAADPAVAVAPLATTTAAAGPLLATHTPIMTAGAPDTSIASEPVLAPIAQAAPDAAMQQTFAPPSDQAPRAMLLVLSRAAKRLVWLFLVLGLIGSVAYGFLFARAVADARASIALHNKVVDDYNQLNAAALTFQSDETSCVTSTSRLTCAKAGYGRLAAAFTKFDNQLAAINVPASAQADLAALRATTAHGAALATQLSHATDANTFAQSSLQFASAISNLDPQVQQLVNDLP